MIKIFIADDHSLVRSGIKSIIVDHERFEVVGEASDGGEAFEKIQDLQPDIAIVDISMPGLTGINLTKKIIQHFPLIKVMILSMHDSEEYISKALEAGATGYLLKDSEREEIVLAIDKIAAGETYCGKNVSQILINSFVRARGKQNMLAPQSEPVLSKREIQIVRLIAKGLSNKEIATTLFISTRTVDAHRYNIMQKTHVRNTAELVMYAVNYKLIE
ncbi:MAG: response regulator transcription factor [Bacteroidota bacterium]|nr:response regulator transcription factor [Bacteroidota bacterium]